jgi:AbrB family looped-hinge helix DNA binding protein
MRVTSKGQVTIPKNIREKLGIMAHSEVEFVEENGRVYLVKSKVEENPFERLLGVGTVKMTTDEIMALTRGEK